MKYFKTFAGLGIDDSQACVERLKELLSNRPRAVLIVMRYLVRIP